MRNPRIASYLRKIKMKKPSKIETVPIIFRKLFDSLHPLGDHHVCEHVTLHAAMATHGYGTFYVTPKMVVNN